MRARQLWADVRHVLLTSAAPALTLATAMATRRAWDPLPSLTSLASALFTFLTAWLLGTVAWTATRSLRDRRAARRLAELRAVAHAPNRALVQVHAVVRTSLAGQVLDVVSIETGNTHRIWLPETNLPAGAFALFERAGTAVSVVDWIPLRAVVAAHRAETRNHVTAAGKANNLDKVLEQHDPASSLAREVEEYLRTQQ